MPDTGAPWFLEYENLLELPTRTLNGGNPPGSSPILARQVHNQLNALVLDPLADHEERLLLVEGLLATADVLLDETDAAGLGIGTVTLEVPTGYRHLTVRWHGNHNAAGGAGRASLIMRFNGDSGNNYGVDAAHSDEPGGNAWVFDGVVTGNAWVRVGYIGSGLRSGGVVHIQNTQASHVTAHGTCVFNGTDSARAVAIAGGSWAGTPPVSTIAIAPLSNDWANGHISLYGHR